MKKFLLAVLAGLGLVTGCSATGVQVLNPAEFKAAVEGDSTAVVLDVRSPKEFAQGHLPDAVELNYLDKEAFARGVKALDPARTYYVYCRSGRRSRSAAEYMQKAGLKVVDMSGGIMKWEAEGLPIVK